MFTGVLVCLQQRLRVAMSALAHKIVGDERQSCPVPSWCLYTSQSLSPSHNTIGHQEGEELSNVENNEGKTILCILSPSSVMNFEILRHRRLIYSYLLTSTHCAFLPPPPLDVHSPRWHCLDYYSLQCLAFPSLGNFPGKIEIVLVKFLLGSFRFQLIRIEWIFVRLGQGVE